MADWIEAGDKARDFTLATHNGTKLKLSNLKGAPVVLYFYPKDDTPGAAPKKPGAQAMGIRVASVSVVRSGLGWRTDSPRSRLGLPDGMRGRRYRPQEARSASDGNPGGDCERGAERVGVADVFPALALGAS
ncbi:MAG: redoxin domain-containing protein [Pirellulales bacterium]